MKIDEIVKSERELYIFSNIIEKNRNGRRVVLWGNSNELREVLKKYFGIEVDFLVTVFESSVNGTSIRHLDTLKDKKSQYYLAIWGHPYDEYYDQLLHEYGFVEIQDYVYRRIKPIIIENWNCSHEDYKDLYGNTIEAKSGVVKKITFCGYNNKLILENGIKGLKNAEFKMDANETVEIGEGTCFQNEVKVSLNGFTGCSSIQIGKWCRFDNTFFRLFNHWMNSEVVIGDSCSFEQNVDFRANSGKKIIIKRDCMFSRDIQLQCGDGHSIFDIRTGNNINTFYRECEKDKNRLYIGEHVWISARVFILNGTYIGNGSVVGAGSIVKGKFPNNCVIAGNPAKLLKRDIAWSREGYAEKINSSVKKEYAVETKEISAELNSNNMEKLFYIKAFKDKYKQNSIKNIFRKIINYENTFFKEDAKTKGTISEVDIDLCTGCGACKNICPRDAIELCPDKEGFLMPVINQKKCVECGLCRKVCAAFSQETFLKQSGSCYALMAEDELRAVSTSGGAFSLLAEKTIEEGGVVCGAAWDENHYVKHIIIQTIDGISKLRGSKYVQSDTGFSFREIKNILEKNRKVLYVGTPCQINGLKHYLQKDYDNLVTIDLLCREITSNELFIKFLNENYEGKTIKSISFRDKKPLGWGATTSYAFSDGSVEKTNTYNSVWICAYGENFMARKSCYNCKFNDKARIGDISLGDFWGIEKYKRSLNDRKGTSIVITSTEKGNRLLKEIEGKCKLLEEVPVEKGVPYNSGLCAHVKMTPKRSMFFEAIKEMPVTAAVDRTIYGKKYDVGIVGWWYNLNYGGTLTYFALNQALKKLGYSVLMVRRSSSGPTMPNDNTVPMRFARKHYAISRLYTARDMHWLNYSCHAFISGSDQLWNPYLEQYSGEEYYLSFVNDHNLKLSYASSFGATVEVPEKYIHKYKPYLERFHGITVREDYAVDLCKKSLGLNVMQICDPVFLCGKEQYGKLADSAKIQLPDKYLLNFLLDPDEKKVKAYRFVQEALGIGSVVNFTDLQEVAERVEKFGEDGAFGNAEIEDFVKAYKEADFVVTDSFHGTCLAIIFNKPFISIANKQRGEKRFISLMNWIGLSDRLVFDLEDLYNRTDLLEPINFEKTMDLIRKAQEKGYDWLKNMLGEIKQIGR